MQAGASVMGLLRDRALTKTFPGLDTVDVYISSFRISDLLFQVTVMAGFSVALVPLLAQYAAKNNQKEMSHLLSGVMGIASVIFGAIALGLFFIFPSIAPMLVQFEGESLTLFIQFGRMTLLSNFLFVFGNAFGQYLITIQRYWIYGITPILYTAGTIFGTLVLTEQYGQLAPMLGTLLGAFLYVMLRLGAVLASGCQIKASLWHPDLPQFFRLMFPRMVALGALQLQLLLFDTVASGLEVGSVTINAYARNFQAVAVGIAGIALAQSAFSLLSQAAAKKEYDRFWIYLRKGIGILLLVTIPGATALVFLSPVAAWLVHLSERLTIFHICIVLYAISIPFESINHLLLRAYYATKETVTPAVFSVVNGGIAIAISWALAPLIGVYALALGFTAGQIMQMLGLSILLPHHIRNKQEEKSWWRKFFKFG